MKSARILTLACVLGAATPAFAQFYNFEDLPSLYWSDAYGASIGGQTDIGSYYGPGLVFGSGVQGIHTSSGYPASSGVLEVWDSNIGNPSISFSTSFSTSQISFWYSTLNGFTATAYNAANVAIGSVTVGPNVNALGTSGISSYADLSASGLISSVVITDPSGLGNFLTIDDLDLQVVPDASSSFALLGLASLGLLAFRKKMVIQ